MSAIAAAYLAEMGIITWRNLHNKKTLPPPSEYVGAAVIFGLLGLAPANYQRATAAFGWTLVLASALNLWNPNSPLNLTTKAAGSSPGKPGTNPSSSGVSLNGSTPAPTPLQEAVGQGIPGSVPGTTIYGPPIPPAGSPPGTA